MVLCGSCRLTILVVPTVTELTTHIILTWLFQIVFFQDIICSRHSAYCKILQLAIYTTTINQAQHDSHWESRGISERCRCYLFITLYNSVAITYSYYFVSSRWIPSSLCTRSSRGARLLLSSPNPTCKFRLWLYNKSKKILQTFIWKQFVASHMVLKLFIAT